MRNVIEAKNIVKTFGTSVDAGHVLDHVSVTIQKGEFIAVMGPSGCGKTTLLFALSGTDSITSGSVRFGDKEISELQEAQLADLRRTKMGFVFQQATMLKNLNLLDNIVLSSAKRSRKNQANIVTKGKELMRQTGISGLENRGITEVSGGQLQRAGICRALMGSPDILFADEPTGSLNSKSSEEIMELFSTIHQRGTAIFLVTHNAKVAARADRVLFMKDGKIRFELCFDKYADNGLEHRTATVLAKMKEIDI